MVKYWPEGIERVFHSEHECIGRNCVIHNPSNHRLREADVIIRVDKMALAERACEHGVGHPDPDSLAYFAVVRPETIGWLGIHGCDGCCRERRINNGGSRGRPR